MGLFENYKRYPLKVSRAQGSFIFDENNKPYLDFTSDISVCNFGHINPYIKSSVLSQIDRAWHISNNFFSEMQESVGQKISSALAMDGSIFFANSGTEANEAAIKLVRKFSGKPGIISFKNSFHGRTFGSMSATGQEKIKNGFHPLLPGFYHATYNDISSVLYFLDLAEKDGYSPAAVMLELIQAEGGVNVSTFDFVQQVSKICSDRGLLLIVDEVQTGLGRTGFKFAFQSYNIEHDVVTIAKALGNGLPVAAMFANKYLHSGLDTGSHGSTFGGNLLGMAAASAVLDLLDENLLSEVKRKSNLLVSILSHLNRPLRYSGLIFGIEFDFSVQAIILKLLEAGLIVLSAGEGNVIRLLPPLNIDDADLIRGAEVIISTIG